jgi:hypothetical protein
MVLTSNGRTVEAGGPPFRPDDRTHGIAGRSVNGGHGYHSALQCTQTAQSQPEGLTVSDVREKIDWPRSGRLLPAIRFTHVLRAV